jgi:hypothetical protein
MTEKEDIQINEELILFTVSCGTRLCKFKFESDVFVFGGGPR